VSDVDLALISRAQEGDLDAFAALVTFYYPQCLRFAKQMLGVREDAEEAVQDAFVRAFRALPRYEHRERFGAWLYRIVANRCRTVALRRQRRERLVIPIDGPFREEAGPENRLDELRFATDDVQRALEALPADQREAFLLRHVEDLSYEEMANVTGAGVSALKMRVKRACDRLRIMLREEDCA
jgi:RNA polymerase sigma-70 factor, ECF subfamily